MEATAPAPSCSGALAGQPKCGDSAAHLVLPRPPPAPSTFPIRIQTRKPGAGLLWLGVASRPRTSRGPARAEAGSGSCQRGGSFLPARAAPLLNRNKPPQARHKTISALSPLSGHSHPCRRDVSKSPSFFRVISSNLQSRFSN